MNMIVLAPSWPGLEPEVKALNRDSSPLKQLDVTKIVERYGGIIRRARQSTDHHGAQPRRHDRPAFLARGLLAAGVGVAPGTVRAFRIFRSRRSGPAGRRPETRSSSAVSRLNRK